MRIAVIDFETATGKADSACAIGLVVVEGARIAARYASLIRPPDEGMHFTNIHGITWEDVENERLFPDVRDEFARHLEGVDYLAAHYAPFDRNVWFALHRRFRLKAPRLAFLCTCQMARQYFPKLPNHKLPTVAAHLGADLKHHDALSDALAAAKIIQVLTKEGLDVEAGKLA